MASLVDADDDDVDLSDGSGPRVHRQSLLRFRRPATGVSGHESLSDSEESRLSPIRAPFGWGELPSEEKAGWTESEEGGAEGDFVLMDKVVVGSVSESSEDAVASDETEDSRSDCALACRAERVYLTVLISSSSGVRNETLFSAGNSGRAEAILRDANGAGPFLRMERRLCGCL